MKKFDSASISSRLLTTLSAVAGWTQIISDSAITSLTGSIGEIEAEAVRYFEYLLQEAKWTKAQNQSSLLAQSAFLGYKPHRKISSVNTDGFVLSHDAQLQQSGVINIFAITDLTDHLIPYSGSPSTMTIPQGTVFTSSGGIPFISTGKTSKSYTTGDKYILIPLIQGVQRSIDIIVLGNPYETIRVNSSSIEAAIGTSSEFFTIFVQSPGSNTTTEYTQIEDIYLGGPTDTVYDVNVAYDYSYIDIRFGNGITGTLLTAGSKITVSYLETLGSAGNVTQNFTITSISSIFDPSYPAFYCTNFTSALGGDDNETIDSIRGQAPLAYLLNGGSIVTSNAYKAAIESIQDILLATVYQSVYLDPVTNASQGSIEYSAIKKDGTAPSLTTFPNDVFEVLEGKTSPLDFTNYNPPAFLHLKLNVQGKTPSSNTNTTDMVNQIQTTLFDRYGTLSQTFKNPFDNSLLTSYVSTTYSLTTVSNQIEAVADLLPSTFEVDPLLTGYYKKAFNFDRSYLRLKGFSDQALHALKVQIYFNCDECQYNGNSFSRTLFVVQTPSTNPSYSITFTLDGPSTGDIIVCGVHIPLVSSDVSTTITLVQAIVTYYLANPGSFTYYVINSNTDFPGILYISPINTTVAPPTVAYGTATGIVFSLYPTINLQTLQYPFISQITDYDYMTSNILKTGATPTPILPIDTTTPYIPIQIALDYGSLNPADLNATDALLGSGILKIPNYLTGSTQKYINFGAGSILDTQISIQVIAQPFSQTITPYYDNNIIQLSNTGLIPDITAQVTYA
jgi:hypothetical protein